MSTFTFTSQCVVMALRWEAKNDTANAVYFLFSNHQIFSGYAHGHKRLHVSSWAAAACFYKSLIKKFPVMRITL